MNRPYVIAKAAVSLDGCLDDSTAQRRVFSSAADLEAVDCLRAGCDAILVGAGTIRRDDPRLVLRNEEYRRSRLQDGAAGDPLKVTVTCSGKLPPESRFFTEGAGDKLVYCAETRADELVTALAGAAQVVPRAAVELSLQALLADLRARGIERLLIEGGADVLDQLFRARLFDELRLAIAPVLIGDPAAPRLGRSPAELGEYLILERCENLVGTAVLHYRRAADR